MPTRQLHCRFQIQDGAQIAAKCTNFLYRVAGIFFWKGVQYMPSILGERSGRSFLGIKLGLFIKELVVQVV